MNELFNSPFELSYMQKHAHYAPGLILLDSPILSLKEIDTQKPSQSMRSGLFENIASTSEGIQTIVIENEIPEIDYSNVNLIHFTKMRTQEDMVFS